MQPFICFVHVGKNGGSTFHHILNDSLPKYLSLNFHPKVRIVENEQFERLEKIRSWSGVGGHTVRHYLNYEEIVGREVFYITFLRDPVKRFVSYVNHRIWRGWSATIEDVLKEDRFNDLQSKYFFKDQAVESTAIDSVLQQLNFVGIVERYDESLVLLKKALPGTLHDIRYQRANVAMERKTNFYEVSKLSDDVLMAIKGKNIVDQKLYDLATNNFNRIVSEYPGDFAADLDAFKKENETYKRPKSKAFKNKFKNAMGNKIFLPYLGKLDTN